ncbi:MAG: hypothetical protein KatS3mg076_2320 [Candidatus Binatia bacterium]|nr:MAG: hypothetical protein KatS3mg076_2320 [Candidatus Binatia bacterium]
MENTPSHVARWVSELRSENVPPRILEEVKHQLLSALASAHAGHFSETGRALAKHVREWGGNKEATTIPSGEKVPLEHAICVNTSLGMALNYDDYYVAGPTPHAVPFCLLALAERHGLSGRDFLAALVAADEIGGRLALALGKSFLDRQLQGTPHALAVAVATSRALGLDAAQTDSALVPVLFHSSRLSPTGFFECEGRLLLASQLAPLGVRAALLASQGFPAGGERLGELVRDLTGQPAERVFEGLGSSWLSDTLSFKTHPGSVAVAGAVDTTLRLLENHAFDSKKIREVRVQVGPLSLAVEERLRGKLGEGDARTAILHFSIAYNVAAALLDKELTARQFLRERIRDPGLWRLVERVHVEANDSLRERMPREDPLGWAWEGGSGVHLETMAFHLYPALLGAAVEVVLEDGRKFSARQDIPDGAAGRTPEERRRHVVEKFRRETRYTLRKERMERVIDLVLNLEKAASPQVRELVRLSCSERV